MLHLPCSTTELVLNAQYILENDITPRLAQINEKQQQDSTLKTGYPLKNLTVDLMLEKVDDVDVLMKARIY